MREAMDMENTVQPDRKLMVLTGRMPKASSTGLMITPPPNPAMAPKVEAMKQIRNRINDMGDTPFLSGRRSACPQRAQYIM